MLTATRGAHHFYISHFMKILAITLALLTPALAQAKCNPVYYTISGRIVTTTGAAIDGANVEAKWLQYGKLERLSVLTENDGRYSLTVKFDPISEISEKRNAMYGCHGKLDSIQIKGSSPGYNSMLKTVDTLLTRTSLDLILRLKSDARKNG
jgi:hypothetical protein